MDGCLVLCVLFVISWSSGSTVQGQETDAKFMQWVAHYEMQDAHLSEIYSVWKKNAEFVAQQNSLGLSYTLSLNQLAHLTTQELVKTPLRVVMDHVPPSEQSPDMSKPLPPSLDWRDKGAVGPIRNQGQCGNGGAFALVDSITSYSFLKNGKLIELSVDEYVDCCLNGSCSEGIFGVSGYKCVAKFGGLACDYPVNTNHTCMSDKVTPCVTIDGGKAVSPSGDELALASTLVQQPVAVAIDASHASFQLYKSGVYYERNCSEVKLDHAVLVVGYGTESGDDYWLVKNSWGTGWGMEGYVKMARNRHNNCGIATMAIYPN